MACIHTFSIYSICIFYFAEMFIQTWLTNKNKIFIIQEQTKLALQGLIYLTEQTLRVHCHLPKYADFQCSNLTS